MNDTYEVNVTIGVRQANMGPGSFQASDTFVIQADGFSELMAILATVHDVANQLRGHVGRPQNRKAGPRD